MKSSNKETSGASHQRILTIVLIVVVVASVSGLFMAMRQNAKAEENWKSPWLPGPKANASEQAVYPTAPKYKDIPNAHWKANRNWKNSLANLPKAPVDYKAQKTLDKAEKSKILVQRSSNRAYDGAPPMIPHAVVSHDVDSCVVCHGPDANVMIAGRRAPVMSHPKMTNCIQCHAPASGLKMLQHSGTVGLVVDSLFEGNKRMGKGTRAYEGAPPTIPHKVSMRQNCMACHGPGMPSALTTPHPMRQNCLQCHAQDANYDNREMLAEPLAPWERKSRKN